jgi:hypothetical protein
LPRNPHSFASDLDAFGAIALGVQALASAFISSDGTGVIHPEPMRFFEVPIVGPLPEDLNYVR